MVVKQLIAVIRTGRQRNRIDDIINSLWALIIPALLEICISKLNEKGRDMFDPAFSLSESISVTISGFLSIHFVQATTPSKADDI